MMMLYTYKMYGCTWIAVRQSDNFSTMFYNFAPKALELRADHLPLHLEPIWLLLVIEERERINALWDPPL